MTVVEMYTLVKFLVNQGQGGYISPDEIVVALNLGSGDKFNEEKRLFEKDSYISDNLRNFKTSSNRAITAGSGTLPSDYSFRTNASNETNGRAAEIVVESEWLSRINDPVAPPSDTYPICSIRSGITVRPLTVTSLTLYYLKKPTPMSITYSTNGNGDITISASTDTDWPTECHDDIVLRALPYLGVPLSNEMLVKFKSFKRSTEGV
jgi:hypothetical protein